MIRVSSTHFLRGVTTAIAIAACACLTLPATFAQTPDGGKPATNTDTISTERPGFTNGTETVTPGRVQLELGYAYSHDHDGWQHRYADTSQLRLPLNERTEVRFGLPVYSSTHPNGGDSQVGWEDASASVKWRFLDPVPHRPSLALIAGTSLPTGRRGLRENNLQPQVALEAEYALSSLWQIQADGVYLRGSDGGTRFNQYSGGLNIGYTVSESVSLFAEGYRIAPTGAGSANGTYTDGGVQYALGPNTQLDLSAGVGVSAAVRGDHFIAAGVSRRW